MAYADYNTNKRTFSHLNACERGQIQALDQGTRTNQGP